MANTNLANRVVVVAQDASLRAILEDVLVGSGYSASAVDPGLSWAQALGTLVPPNLAVVDHHPSSQVSQRAVTQLKTMFPNLKVLHLDLDGDKAARGDEDVHLSRPLLARHWIARVADLLGVEPLAWPPPSLIIPGAATHLPIALPVGVPAVPAVAAATGWGGAPEVPFQQSPTFQALNPAHGTFVEGALPGLLWACVQQRVTGKLQVEGENAPAKSVFFEAGQPVAFLSPLKSDRLEEHLLKRGFLNTAQATAAKANAASGSRGAAQSLVEEGILKAHEVFELLASHLRDRFASLLDLGAGRFSFLSQSAPTADRLPLEESPGALLWRCMGKKFPQERLMPLLGGPSTLVVPQAPVDLRSLGVDPAQARVAAALDGAHTFWDAAQACRVPLEQVYSMAFLLLTVGAVKTVSRGPETTPLHGQRAGQLDIDRARVLELLRRCRECNYFEMLGLHPQATRVEVAMALNVRLETVEPRRLEEPGLLDLKPAGQEIRSILQACAQVLLSDAVRQRYRAALGA